MEKGITSYFGYNQPMEENIKQIKNAGFTRVMGATDTKYEKVNGTLDSQIELIKKYGLKLGSLHAKYDEDTAEKFWEEGEIGEQITQSFIDDIILCNKYKFTCLVMHIYGKPSIIGDERFERILKEAKKYNVVLAIENLIDLTPFYHLLTKYTDENVKVCLDIGHKNCFSINQNIYKSFGSRIVTTHLHDNDGLYDLHTTTLLAKKPDIHPKYPESKIYQTTKQNVNWQEFAHCVAVNNLDLALDYELNNNVMECKDIPPTEMLNQCIKESNQLEEKIAIEKFKVKKLIEKAELLLSESTECQVSSVSPEGYPRICILKQLKTNGIKEIYFSTATSSVKVSHYKLNKKAGVTFYNSNDSVTLVGKMSIVDDKKIKDSLWSKWLEKHFSNLGKDDPEYCILKFEAKEATIYINEEFETIKI